MKTRMTFEWDARCRRAVARQTIRGGGLATRADMIAWIEKTLAATMDVLVTEMDEAGDAPEPEKDR